MKILFLGDVCPTNDYRRLFDDTSGKLLFNNVMDLINDADYAVCNFECPATDQENAIKKCGPSLRAKPQDVKMLKNAGISALSLANNHILDYGTQGLKDTVNSCNEAEMPFFGAEINGNSDKDRIVLSKENEKVTVFSFAEREFNYIKEEKTGAIQFDPYDTFDKIREAKKIGKVVVLYHGGIEYYRYPSPLLRKKCVKMAEAGADLILCQHSHIIGTKETVNDCYILYGQGNSVFGYREKNETWNEGLMVTFDTNEGVSLDLTVAKKEGVFIAEETRKKEVIIDIESLSENWTEVFIEEQWKRFCKTKESLYYPMLYGKGRIYNKINRITKNKLFSTLTNKTKKMTTMNLIRCDAHREVVKTLLEEDYE